MRASKNLRLFKAIKENDLGAVKEVCSDKHSLGPEGTIKLNEQNEQENGSTPLCLAARLGHLQIVRYLTTEIPPEYIDVNAVNKHNSTPLNAAARKGKLRVVEYLVGLDAIDLNLCDTYDEGGSPLCNAVRFGHQEIAKCLSNLEKTNLKLGDRLGRCPLTLAVRYNRIDIVEHLWQKENVDVNQLDNIRRPPLGHAARFGNDRILEFMCQSVSKRMELDVNLPDVHGSTPLHLAVATGKLKSVEVLLEDVDLNLQVRDHERKTPLEVAVQGNYYQIALMIAMKIEISRLDVNKQYEHKDTLLHMAVRSANEKALEYLCNIPGVRNIKNDDGLTPLDLAAASHKCPSRFVLCLFRLLNGAEKSNIINKRFTGTKSLLHIAVENNDQNALEELLFVEGLDLNLASDGCNTALHLAAINKNLGLVYFLSEQAGVKCLKNSEGLTPIDILATKEIDDCILLDLALKFPPVDPKKTFQNGRSFVHLAVSCGSETALQHFSQMTTAEIENLVDDFGDNPLNLAVKRGEISVLEMLCDKIKLRKEYYRLVLNEIVKKEPCKIDTKKTYSEGNTLIHLAVKNCYDDEQVIKYLCKLPGAENTKNDDGRTPYEIALTKASNTIPPNFLVHLFLLPGGGSKRVNQKFKGGKTLLHLAIEELDREILERLSSVPGIRNIKDDTSNTPFRLVVENQRYPLHFLLFLYKLPGADITNINELFRNEKTLLHLAVEESDCKFVNSLLSPRQEKHNKRFVENYDIDINVRDKNDMTALQRCIDQNRLDMVKLLCSQQSIDLNLRNNDDEAPLSVAVRKKHFDICLLLLGQKSIDIDIQLKDHNGCEVKVLKILRDIIISKEEENLARINDSTSSYLLEKYLTETLVELPTELALCELMEHKDPPLLQFLREVEDETGIESHSMTVAQSLFNVIFIGLQKYQDQDCLQKLLYQSHIFKTLVQIFVEQVNAYVYTEEPDNYMVQSLRTIYLSLQVNNHCDKATGDYLKESLDDWDLLLLFETCIHDLAKVDSVESASSVCGECQLIAASIYNTYFKEDSKDCLARLTDCLEKFGTCLARCLCCFANIAHDCTQRSHFEFIKCFFFLIIHVLDIVSDVWVGLKTLRGFSKELGIFMLVIALFALIVENFRFPVVLYGTEKELLKMKLGKLKLQPSDWENSSNLNTYYETKNRYLRGFYQFFWSFNVMNRKSTDQKIRSFTFNVLSLLWLRPLVYRLLFVTHRPCSLRELHCFKSRENSLNQYFMVMEQLPELLVKFYIFQIILNNNNPECDTERNSFNYDPQHFLSQCTESWRLQVVESNDSWIGIKICSSWIRVYSIVVPFLKIPGSLILLESMFRNLNPATPNMSKATTGILYVAYIVMIPSRLFLYASLMHAAPEKFYVIGYLVAVSFIWFSFNMYSTRQRVKRHKLKKDGNPVIEKWPVFKKWQKWRLLSLMLISFRDVMVVSLRKPIAYITKPSQVTHHSLKCWKEIMVSATYFFIEGLVGAILIENYYPCGLRSDIFKYQGWFWLALQIWSVTTVILISYILQPEKKNKIYFRFNEKSLLLCSFGLILWFVASTSFFVSHDRTIDWEKWFVMIVSSTLVCLFGTTIFVLRYFGESLGNVGKPTDSKEQSSPEKDGNISCYGGNESDSERRETLRHRQGRCESQNRLLERRNASSPV